jgi:uncharacterized protein (TIGR03437 family)
VVQDPARVCAVNDVASPCPLDYFDANVQFVRDFAKNRASFVTTSLQSVGWVPDGKIPGLTLGTVMNAASGVQVLAPGTMGLVRAPLPIKAAARAASFPLPTSLGGVSVTVGGVPAPLFVVSETEIWFQTPTELLDGPTAVVVTDVVGNTHTWPIEVRASSPGIFAVTHANGSLVTSTDAATAGELLVVWATGLGHAVSDEASGQPAPTNRLVTMKSPVTAQIGGASADVLWAGLAPGYASMQEVILRVPNGLGTGNWGLRLVMFGDAGGGYSLAIR